MKDGERPDPFAELTNPDTAAAWQALLSLRQRLITFFRLRRCSDPEELADKAIMIAWERQAKDGVIHTELQRYCFGVAQKLAQEDFKKRTLHQLPEELDPADPNAQRSIDCLHSRIELTRWLNQLSAAERKLLIRYYCSDRRALADQLKITPNSLRIRVHRLLDRVRKATRAGRDGPET